MTKKIVRLYEIQVLCVKIKYMQCHVSLYSKQININSCNKFSNIPINFHLQLKFLDDIIKVDIKVNIFITY